MKATAFKPLKNYKYLPGYFQDDEMDQMDSFVKSSQFLVLGKFPKTISKEPTTNCCV
jgi:hypothetical protein